MLESLVTSLFNKYLGPFVENLDGSQLVGCHNETYCCDVVGADSTMTIIFPCSCFQRLSLLTGSITLKDLAIKPDAISTLLDLPVRVVSGSIGSISLNIPLASLRSKPTILTVDEIYLLVSPWFKGKALSSLIVTAAKLKNALLRTIEQHYITAKLGAVVQKGASVAPDDDSKLFEGLVGTIIANLQVLLYHCTAK